MNFDISVFKNMPVGGTRRLQFRSSSTTRSTPTSGRLSTRRANFDYTTGALTEPGRVRQLTGATLSARRIQLGARFTF